MKNTVTTLLAVAALLASGGWSAPATAGDCNGGATASTAGYDGKHAQKDIVETAVAAGSFKTLATALKTAGLVEALQGDGPFTVFAPTDEAFAKLPEGTVEELLKPENREQLKRILTYHVVPGKVTAAAVADLEKAEALSGDALRIQAEEGVVRIDEARVLQADVMASNGVIHVIDTVLIPGQES